MRKIQKLAAVIAATFVVCGASAFADSRHQDETRRGSRGNQGQSDRGYRDNERVTGEGRVTSVSRDRGGYRVQLDRGGYGYYVPESALRSRGRDLRTGVSVRLGGVFRGGWINVDVVDWPGGGGGGYYDDRYDGRAYGNGYVRGAVERVDFRRGTIELRDDSTGRFVTVDMRRTARRSVDLEDLRRGDYVEISGQWVRGVFEAHRIDGVRSRRY